MTQTDDLIIPFRWDVSRREQLGSLAEGELAEVPEGYYDHLRDVSAKVVARSDDSQLVFVGRSPEHIFDYLSGAFACVEDAPALTLLQFSRGHTDEVWNPTSHRSGFTEAERGAFLGYLRSESIDPASLATAKRTLRFVDMVWSGTTYRSLLGLFRELSNEQGADWNVVSKRMGFIGITNREKNSPNTYRWQQSDYWTEVGGSIAAKNVSVPWDFWGHAANLADKVTPSFHRRRWLSAQAASPVHSERALKAIRRSVDVYDFAASRQERLRLARELASLQEFREPWLRKLALDLKTNAGSS